MLEYEGIQITWLGHDGFKLKKDKVVYVDPYQLKSAAEPADVACVTHEHFDHLSVEDLKKVVTPHTTIVTIAACEEAAKGLRPNAVRLVKPGDRVQVEGIAIEAVPAYNTSKFRAPGKPFHPQADGKVGFVLGATRSCGSVPVICSTRGRRPVPAAGSSMLSRSPAICEGGLRCSSRFMR